MTEKMKVTRLDGRESLQNADGSWAGSTAGASQATPPTSNAVRVIAGTPEEVATWVDTYNEYGVDALPVDVAAAVNTLDSESLDPDTDVDDVVDAGACDICTYPLGADSYYPGLCNECTHDERKDALRRGPEALFDYYVPLRFAGYSHPLSDDAAAIAAAARDGAISDRDCKAVNIAASRLHDNWRAGRLQDDDTFEPRWKDDGAGGQIDIANTDYADLPQKWQQENRDAAIDAYAAIIAIEREYGHGAFSMEIAAACVHDAWLARNHEWAEPEQKSRYHALTEVEKHKDRDVVNGYLIAQTLLALRGT